MDAGQCGSQLEPQVSGVGYVCRLIDSKTVLKTSSTVFVQSVTRAASVGHRGVAFAAGLPTLPAQGSDLLIASTIPWSSVRAALAGFKRRRPRIDGMKKNPDLAADATILDASRRRACLDYGARRIISG
jgi:hypothetical protein